jgi:UDP-N-acetylglucosamine transferase subunit ALG13
MKIFVSVGTQLKFKRLIDSVLEAVKSEEHQVVIQTADPELELDGVVTHDFLLPEQYEKYFSECDIFVSHAGMGSLITALEAAKPIIVMPRKLQFGEHRNDHQVATAEQFKKFKSVNVVNSSSEIKASLDQLINSDNTESVELKVENSLIEFIEDVITTC